MFDWYYGLIDFEFWLRKYGGDDVVAWIKANVHPLDIVFRLAEDHGIVLLNGGGFDAPDWSVRVSFANLDDDVYDDIGRAVRAVARGYVMALPGLAGGGAAATVASARRKGLDDGHALPDSCASIPRSRSSSFSGIGYLLGKLKLGSFTLAPSPARCSPVWPSASSACRCRTK